MRDFYLSKVWVALRRVALLHAAVMLFQWHHYEITLKLASTESGKRDQLNSAISSDQEFADMNCYGTNADNSWELPWSHQGRWCALLAADGTIWGCGGVREHIDHGRSDWQVCHVHMFQFHCITFIIISWYSWRNEQCGHRPMMCVAGVCCRSLLTYSGNVFTEDAGKFWMWIWRVVLPLPLYQQACMFCEVLWTWGCCTSIMMNSAIPTPNGTPQQYVWCIAVVMSEDIFRCSMDSQANKVLTWWLNISDTRLITLLTLMFVEHFDTDI